ncbi:MAG: hypothetical protein PGN24_01495 [Microbacterium arborescens]
MRRPMLFVGILLIAAGMIVIAAGTGASSDRGVALGAITGLAFGLAFPLAGIVSQIPHSVNGSNGEFVPGAGPVVGVMTCAGVGLSAGLLLGVLARLLARSASRRSHRPSVPSRS